MNSNDLFNHIDYVRSVRSPSEWEKFVRDFQLRISRSDSDRSFNQIIKEHFNNDSKK